MFIALTVITIVYALLLSYSALGKLRREEQVVSVIHTIGVPLNMLAALAAAELAGGAGILIGLWFEPLGIAAAIGLVVYFVLAVGAHLRVGDTRGVAAPVLPLVLAIAVLVLRSVTT